MFLLGDLFANGIFFFLMKKNVALFINIIIKIAHTFAMLKSWKSHICPQGTAQSLMLCTFSNFGDFTISLEIFGVLLKAWGYTLT